MDLIARIKEIKGHCPDPVSYTGGVTVVFEVSRAGEQLHASS